MSREKNLAKNTAILAIGQLSSKIFTFLLLPVYTSLLSPDDFGTIDAELLAYPLDDALFGLPGKEHVHVDAVAGVDD